ncbi:MAG: hypothetical protein CMF19_04495 [Idiomarinaceae bacterium]|nr:hypothetical protein [Idiomarinaceae bacterium]
MAIDNETEAAIRKDLNQFLMELHRRYDEDTGPLIATTLIRTGSAMYFYCESDPTAAGIAVLQAATSGIEQARHLVFEDQVEEAQNATLQ